MSSAPLRKALSTIRVLGALILGALSAAGAATAAEPLKTLNVSYVKSPFNIQLMVTRKLGLLDREFAKDGIAVTWHDITSGAHQTQAMAAGSLDIGGVVGSTSVLLANAGGNAVRIAGGVSRPSKTFAIVVPGNGVTSVRELKGRTIAGPKGTTLHQLLAAALAKDGMGLGDVNYLSMDLPKASAALSAGHIDAALLAAALVVKAEKAGARVLATADGLISPTLVIAVRPNFAQEHPDILARYLKVHKEATALIRADAGRAIAIGAEEQGLTVDEAAMLHDWNGMTDTLTPADVESLRQDAAFLVDNGMMRPGLRVEDSFLPEAFR